MASPLLEIRGLTKRFGGTLALDAVDFEVRPGEVHALLGENGAGKSTLIKILAGVHAADSGEILWNGRAVTLAADRPPIAFIHQDLGLVESMTVAENVAILAGYPRRGGRAGGLISWPRAERDAARILHRMGGDIAPDSRVRDLSVAAKAVVAIARALAVRCDMLVLDEPTAALPEVDVARLLRILGGLRDGGMGILYVTHRLDEVFRIADRVTVLRDGRRIATRVTAETSPGALVHDIVGRVLDELDVRPREAGAAPVLEVDALVATGVGPVSFRVPRGEVLGLVGLRGAGHGVVGRALFGDTPILSGTVRLDGAPLRPHAPGEAIARGVGLVSSKRREESVAATLTVRENLFVNPLLAGASRFAPIIPERERARCAQVLRRLAVRPPDTERPILMLSGGNQQKVVLSRWMEAGSRVFVLEEPTFGVDVGAKGEIYRMLQDLLGRGAAVLLVSSDFEEVATICHRALVFDRGRVRAELDRAALSVPRLTALAAGAEAGGAARPELGR
ncbi:MAG TPA: sugar ABC transporter ATP-binding protein [Acetobacteraceae bacterium]|nr:sugar ABC transporter ATP-binding protein [Acetobacteraceae bacterium]